VIQKHALIPTSDFTVPLVIEGTTRVSEAHPGRVSTHSNISNSFVVNGRIKLPIQVSITAEFSANSANTQTRDERIRIARQWLTDAQDRAIILNFQSPGQPLVEQLVLESYDFQQDRTDKLICSIQLVEAKLARTRSAYIDLQNKVRKGGGGPRGEYSDGLSAEDDQGTGLKSIAASLKDGTSGLLDTFDGYINRYRKAGR